MQKSTKLGQQYFDDNIPLWAQDLGWVTAEARENHLRTLYLEDGLSDFEKECIHEELWGWPQDSDDEKEQDSDDGEEQDSDDEEEEPATSLTPPPPMQDAPTAPPAPPATTLSLSPLAPSATPVTGVPNAPTAPPAPTQGTSGGKGNNYDSGYGSATDGENSSSDWWSDGEGKRSTVESQGGELDEKTTEMRNNDGAIQTTRNTHPNNNTGHLIYIAGDLEGEVSSGGSDESPSDESEDEKGDEFVSEEEDREEWDEEEEDQDWDEGFEYDDVPKKGDDEEVEHEGMAPTPDRRLQR